MTCGIARMDPLHPMALLLLMSLRTSFLSAHETLHKHTEHFVEEDRGVLGNVATNKSSRSINGENLLSDLPRHVIQPSKENLNDSSQWQSWTLKLAKGSREEDEGGQSFMDWAKAFFPRKHVSISSVERFLKIVGIHSHQLCTPSIFPENQTSLDFSSGWEQRTILYLYRANKTTVSCTPYDHTGEPQLSVIDGSSLQNELANSTNAKTCTVVFFFSPSCPYSRRAAPFVQAAAVYFPILRLLAVNTDKFPGVAGHYGIMGVPVIVLFHGKKFITGWTIPYPDARDTVRAFIMAYTDVKYVPERLNLTGLEGGIIAHFGLQKHNNFLYMIAYIVVLGSFILYFWKSYLLDLIKRSVEQSGIMEHRIDILPLGPLPPGHDVIVGGAP